MTTIRFGPAGIPASCEGNTADGVRKCAELGLEAMEIEFVRSVYLKTDEALKVGKAADENNVRLSAHAPYFINCCSLEEKKVQNSYGYLLSSAKALANADGGVVVFHPGFYMKQPKDACMKQVIHLMERVYAKADKSIRLGPELMGKPTQFGSAEEIIHLAQHFGLKHCCPVIDWGHLNSRTNGSLKTKADYKKILDLFEKELTSAVFKNFHSHFSEQEYSEKGERRHIPMGTGGPHFNPLIELFVEHGYSGTFICESPLMEQDALKMKRMYLELV
jgi:deoxyribonuclease-4